MIGRLRGKLWERLAHNIVVDVQGVGYVVRVTPRFTAVLGEQVDLHIYTQVREDALNLFGFDDARERELFDLLIGVPNVGPVKAMQILSSPLESFVQAVLEGQPAKLSKLPGVGKKTAERILLDLKDKVGHLGSASSLPVAASEPPPVAKGHSDLVSALVNLGFKEAKAVERAEAAAAQHGDDAELEVLLRTALASGN